jgi:hypothetical protein
MILDDPHEISDTPCWAMRVTLDDLLHRNAVQHPDRMALFDPANRASFTDGAARRLTHAQADHMVSAIAGRLCQLRLSSDAIVALQMSNTVESVLALLGVMRAGFIAMPLPLLWRRADIVAALGRVGAQAFLVSGRVGSADHFDLAREVGSECFSLRHIGGFGANIPDGVVSYDDLFAQAAIDPPPRPERSGLAGPGAHLAIITWDVTADGPVPVARNHAELITGGVGVLLEGRISQDTVLFTTLTMASFAGLALSLVPWLMSGAALVLHQPFDAAACAAQLANDDCNTLVVPGPLLEQLTNAGLLSGRVRSVIAAWRAPERLLRSATWPDRDTALIDAQVFGETGLVVARRDPHGRPATLPNGIVTAPRGGKDRIVVAETTVTERNTMALRGPMVPRTSFPPGAERSGLPYLKIAPSGFIDTGYGCQIEPGGKELTLSDPPVGLVSVGGYRFRSRDMQETVGALDSVGSVLVLPDALAGQRLAGLAADRDLIRAALARLGSNPLLVNAFRGQDRPAA